MLNRNPEPDGSTVVLNEERTGSRVEMLENRCRELGEVVERVFELVDSRSVAVPEPGIIRRDDVKLLSESRDQVSVHM
jgi:hypothetical protein